ncbi:MAG: hypothetical protein J0I20_03540 [Chloroflexi bacterium]|nr:hypothetical protein [Chloroflexota bacterium]OJV89178.1 MAG: hypothetical protein BGO39_34805 [Chloroflexi bacterium 54-19]
MKALILFDGSSSSFTCLKVACEDATALVESQCGQAGTLELNEALLLLVKVSGDYQPSAGKPCAGPDPARLLLEHGIRKLECSGEFDNVTAEIIVCPTNNLTEVIQDRAREWKATTIYLALDPTITPVTTRIGWWQRYGLKLGGNKNRVEPALFRPQTPLTTAQVRVKQLLENSGGRIVVVDNAGVPMRLSYYPPTHHSALFQRSLPARNGVGHVA